MDDEFEVTWEVEDGYAGPSRSQHSTLSAFDIEDDMTDEDLESLFDEWLEEEFRQAIGVYSSNREAAIEWMREKRDEMAEAAE